VCAAARPRPSAEPVMKTRAIRSSRSRPRCLAAIMASRMPVTPVPLPGENVRRLARLDSGLTGWAPPVTLTWWLRGDAGGVGAGGGVERHGRADDAPASAADLPAR